MAKSSGIKLNLPSADDLFSTQEERDEAKRETLIDLPVEEISDFLNHPFKVKMEESMAALVESVREYGVLNPALVRPKPEGGYEMIAGYRRKLASELAGRQEIPCIVRNLSDDEATIIMVDSNLQREEVLPSEKAFAYKMKLEAMNRQAGRPTKNLTPVVSDFSGIRTNEVLAKEVGESRETIRRYIRLTELIPPVLDMVDNEMESMIGSSFKKVKAKCYNDHKHGFYVFAKPSLCDPKTVIKYIGRYLGRPVIATSRIDKYDGENVLSITTATKMKNT